MKATRVQNLHPEAIVAPNSAVCGLLFTKDFTKDFTKNFTKDFKNSSISFVKAWYEMR